MKLQTVAKLLIAFGVAVVIYALNMPVSIGYSNVVNIHLMNERQNTLIIGGLMFIAGIILFATFKAKQTTEDAALAESDAQARKQTQKKIADQTKLSLQGMAQKVQSKLAESWRDHGVARLINGVFVGLCVLGAMPYRESGMLDFVTLIPLVLAFRSCPAQTAVIQMHLLNLVFSTLMLTVVHRDDLALLSIFVATAIFVAHAKWKLRPIPKPLSSA